MQFDYFYGSQADQFSFYRIPKVLFTDPQFKPLSTDARNPLGAFRHKQDSTLVAEQTTISSIYRFLCVNM